MLDIHARAHRNHNIMLDTHPRPAPQRYYDECSIGAHNVDEDRRHLFYNNQIPCMEGRSSVLTVQYIYLDLIMLQ